MQVPITVIPLFSKLDALLIDCLRSCSNEDWNRPTLARKWTIKDVAAHLLDGNIRALSMGRDGWFGEQPPHINDYKDLVNWLNSLNANWVASMKRMSGPMLIELLELTGRQSTAYYQSLDPFAPALFPVAWAGQNESPNWFHIAREYTEKWHHQAQIREALGTIDCLLSKDLYHPFLQTFFAALPYQYSAVNAPEGTTIQVVISGEAGGYWLLSKSATGWKLINEPIDKPTAQIQLAPEIAWKLFTKGIRPDELLKNHADLVQLSGPSNLTLPSLNLVAVMA